MDPVQTPPRIADTQSVVSNPNAINAVTYPPHLSAVLDETEAGAARAEIVRWPGYQTTPLTALPALAARSGVASVYYKDEGGRFGLGSFKALGGAYAVLRVIQKHLRSLGIEASTQSLISGDFRKETTDVTVTCATDGNHGRSVAWGAKTFGCRCVIYVHQTVSQGRVDAVAHYGAEVIRHPGNYDDTVHRAAEDAAKNAWTVVSDTSYEGYVDIPRDVMHGYTLMCAEALDQWPEVLPPTHVVVPGGVGGVAAAVCAAAWWRYGEHRPRMIVVEPTRAACLLESAATGKRALLTGDIETVMAGLSCGEPSVLAWELLNVGADSFIAVSDDEAIAAMRRLASGGNSDGERDGDRDPGLVSGESAASVEAVLARAADDASIRDALALDAGSRVLMFGTEGDTDPELYTQLVGRSADMVRSA
jgi:diaminopropionate ammonia-lyase